MACHWREYAKTFTTPHQRHQLIMLREWLYAPYVPRNEALYHWLGYRFSW